MESYVKQPIFRAEAEKERAYPLKSAASFDALLERVGDAKCVSLGEACHGTHEYYTWRTAISKRLIEEKGFASPAYQSRWQSVARNLSVFF